MSGRDYTGFSSFLESMQDMGLDKKQEKDRLEEIEARLKVLEEQEKIWCENRAVLVSEVQDRLCQELERAGLKEKGNEDG